MSNKDKKNIFIRRIEFELLIIVGKRFDYFYFFFLS